MSSPEIRPLNLDRLKQGLPGATPERCRDYLHALLVCFHDQHHQTGVLFKVLLNSGGTQESMFRVRWQDEVTEQILLTWNDMEEATEEAAYGMAFLLILQLTDFTIIGRSARTTGIDWWLGDKQAVDTLPFDKKARLEVSGILREKSASRIKGRVAQNIEAGAAERCR